MKTALRAAREHHAGSDLIAVCVSCRRVGGIQSLSVESEVRIGQGVSEASDVGITPCLASFCSGIWFGNAHAVRYRIEAFWENGGLIVRSLLELGPFEIGPEDRPPADSDLSDPYQRGLGSPEETKKRG